MRRFVLAGLVVVAVLLVTMLGQVAELPLLLTVARQNSCPRPWL